MKIEYDPEVDALYVRLTESKIIESEQVQPGIVLDFDEAGKVVGLEVLNASKRQTPATPLKGSRLTPKHKARDCGLLTDRTSSLSRPGRARQAASPSRRRRLFQARRHGSPRGTYSFLSSVAAIRPRLPIVVCR